ncbi:MAG: hypothetical protein HN368_00865, partial [Spirochaetales bacterium]|nr:hypothetical protein [Spirochaetales bacterium]
MNEATTWNPLTDWRHTDTKWIKVDISRENLGRFTKRSNIKGLTHALVFFLIICGTGTLAYFAFSRKLWILLAAALYIHGTFYSFFGNSLHELSHNTVFASRWLNIVFTSFFGWLYWAYNPHFYRLSHQKYHHRYTLYQGSDGEDVPNYIAITPRMIAELFLRVIHIKSLVQILGRLFTLKPTSRGWRGRGYKLDFWEQFIKQNATKKEWRQVKRMAIASLVGHVVFTGLCIY